MNRNLRQQWQINKYLWMAVAFALVYIPVANRRGLAHDTAVGRVGFVRGRRRECRTAELVRVSGGKSSGKTPRRARRPELDIHLRGHWDYFSRDCLRQRAAKRFVAAVLHHDDFGVAVRFAAPDPAYRPACGGRVCAIYIPGSVVYQPAFFA